MGADEEIKNEELQDDTPVDDKTKDKLEVDTDDVVDSEGKKPNDHVSFVKGIMNKLSSFGGSSENEDEDTNESNLDIPDEFTKAAFENGWTEEDIIDWAEQHTNEQLLEQIPFLLDEEEQELEPEEKPEDKKKETPSDKLPTSDDKTVEAIKEAIRKEFQAEIEELKKDRKEREAIAEAQEQELVLVAINKAFDEAGKQFEVFGKTKDLPVFPAGPKKGQYIPTSPEMKARQEVYGKAVAFIQAGQPVEDAMQDALTWYKGKYLEKDVKRNLVKDLKNNEKKLSAKRSAKETEKKYEDEDDYREQFIRREAEKRGIKLEK